MQAWIVVGSPENFETLRRRGFDVAAFKSTRRNQAEEMEPGDHLVYYLTGIVGFGGIVEVTSEIFEDHADVGLRSESEREEDFPYRVETEPVLVLPEGEYVDVREVADRLEKTRRYGPKKLGLAFRGNLHRISEDDYRTIEKLLEEKAGA